MQRQWTAALVITIGCGTATWAGDNFRVLPIPPAQSAGQPEPIAAPMPVGKPMAGNDVNFLPIPAPAAQRATPMIQAPAPEPIAAPAASAPAKAPAPAANSCCTAGCCHTDICDGWGGSCPKPRREHFTLCDWWQILKACLYCER
jgi:hypothetical protein